MVLFWPILAPKYEVPKLNTPKYVNMYMYDVIDKVLLRKEVRRKGTDYGI
jgi:hypothetical protein